MACFWTWIKAITRSSADAEKPAQCVSVWSRLNTISGFTVYRKWKYGRQRALRILLYYFVVDSNSKRRAVGNRTAEKKPLPVSAWTGNSNMATNLTSPSTLLTSYRARKRLKWHPDARSAETGSGNMAETTEIDTAYATSYSRSVVTMPLSRPVSEI